MTFGSTAENYWVDDSENVFSRRVIWGNIGNPPVNLCTFMNNYRSGIITYYPSTGTEEVVAIRLTRSQTQYLTAPDSPSLSQTGDITVEAWVNFSSLPNGNLQFWPIIAKNNFAQYEGEYLMMYYQATDGVRYFDLRTRLWNFSSTEELAYAFDVETNRWYHVAYTRDSRTGLQIFYLDGVQATMRNGVSGQGADSADPLWIGRWSARQNDYFDGLIDDVRIWNVVRTESEISTHRSVSLTGTEPGLQANWRFENSLFDSTMNDNNLNDAGGAVFDYGAFPSTAGILVDPLSFISANSSASNCMCGAEPRVQ